MSYDKLIETPTLPYDAQRIKKGGDDLALYIAELLVVLGTRLEELNRYANHFRTWTHASDFDKIDGGDHYAGSIATAAAALTAWTNPLSAYTQASTPISDVMSIEQTRTYTATGKSIIFWWGASIGYSTAPTKVSLYLYRGDDVLVTLGPITTVSGDILPHFGCYSEAPAAGDYTYTLRAICAPAGGVATVSNITIIAMEAKR